MNLALSSRLPMALLWGKELCLLYNDAYSEIAGGRHPGALGQPGREVLEPACGLGAPVAAAVMQRGETVYVEGARLSVGRGRERADVSFAVCFSPLRCDDGAIRGIFVTLQETAVRATRQAVSAAAARTDAARSAGEAVDRMLFDAIDLGPDRKRGAPALRESEARFRDLADSIAQLAWMTDETGSVVWYNRRWFDFTGTTLAEVSGWGWRKLLHPAHADRVVEKIRAHFRSGEVWEDTFPLRGRDGSYRWFLSRAVPIENDTGEVLRWFGTNTDVTDQRATEEALRTSEREFRALIENLYTGVALIDAEGRFSLYNARFLELFGLSSGSDITNVNSQDWSAWRVFDDEGSLLQVDDHPVRKAALRHETVRNQLVGVRLPAGGDLVWMLVSAAPVVAGDGKLERVICTYHEITGLKRAEEALRRSEERARASEAMLDAFFEASPGILNVADEELRYVKTDSLTPRYFGLTREAVVGRGLAELAPEFVARFGAMMRDVIETGVPRLDQEVDLEHPRRQGTATTWRASYFPVPLASGRRGLGVMGVEITDIRKAQEEQRRLMEALHEADRQKDAFLAVLSHELRNPLAPIRNSIHVLERAAPGGEQARRALSVLDRQVTHMTRLIDDLLDVTRISRGKIRLQRESLDLNEVVQGTGEDLRPLFRSNGVDLVLSIGERPLRAFADRTRVAQVVGNLLQNAAKFTPSGGRVELSLEGSAEAGARTTTGNPDAGARREAEAVITVRDTGAGIDPGVLDRVFEPFVQAEATLDRTAGGLGLGLALVKGLVDLHGGSVSARSAGPGAGSEFEVRLPLERAEAPATAIAPPPAARPRRATLRVLLIEDSVDAAASLKDALELSGHEVEAASTGIEGIEKARAFRPDVVLCDIGLPGIDGLEVARRMRRDPALRGACLVALSGYAAPEDLERSKEAGFVLHLAKPPDVAALETRLVDACRPLRGSSPGPRSGDSAAFEAS